jgi:hypothetical protein
MRRAVRLRSVDARPGIARRIAFVTEIRNHVLAEQGGLHMSLVVKALIGLSCLAFVLAVYVSQVGELLRAPAESYSRASSNLALIAIALLLMNGKGSKS